HPQLLAPSEETPALPDGPPELDGSENDSLKQRAERRKEERKEEKAEGEREPDFAVDDRNARYQPALLEHEVFDGRVEERQEDGRREEDEDRHRAGERHV